MLRVTLKGLLEHKIRFILTTLAVVVGVAFVVVLFVVVGSPGLPVLWDSLSGWIWVLQNRNPATMMSSE